MEILRPSSSEIPQFESPPSISGPRPKMELEDFICVLQIQPNDSFMALELARCLMRSSREREALQVLRALVRMDNRFETVYELGQLEYQMDLINEAFQHLQQALLLAPEGSPELFAIFKTLGNIFVRRGDWESAEDSYYKAHRLNPSSDVLWVNLGTLAVQKQNWDDAAEKFRAALTMNPCSDKAWVGLAISHRMKADHELAWANLEAALEHNPLNEVAMQLVLDWGLADGRESRVLEHVRNFLVEGGWNEKVSLAFAWLSYRQGDRDRAQLELERLLAVNPTYERALMLAQEMRGGA